MQITRYAVREKRLAPWVRFIWHMDLPDADIYRKLLPTASVDLILNLGAEMVYEVDGAELAAPKIHINGLRDRHSMIRQVGHISVFGIALQPYGLYPFVGGSLEGIRDAVADLEGLSPRLCQKLAAAVQGCGEAEAVRGIERALCAELGGADGQAELVREFLYGGETVQAFCGRRCLNVKTFERLVVRYTGYTPKRLRDVIRFQGASNQLVHGEPGSLADLAYENGYADQAHFTRTFRRFCGRAPRAFRREGASVKEVAVYRYR